VHGDIEVERRRRRRCPVPAHVSAERLPGGEHGGAGGAPVHVGGGGALAGARAEEEVEAVRAHQRPLVARPVPAQRLERRERAPARLAPERAAAGPVLLLLVAADDAAVLLLRDHLARRRRQRQVQPQQLGVVARRRRRSFGGRGGHVRSTIH